MLIAFFYHLRQSGLKIATDEFLGLLAALERHAIGPQLDEFYSLTRATLIKDERLYDRFDLAFGQFFDGIEAQAELELAVPESWLQQMQQALDPKEFDKLEKLGFDQLLETLKKRLEEQKERHAGGNRWIGSGGTSPFGAHGFHPEGVRIGGESGGNRTAVKVWAQRAFRNYDDAQALGVRNFQVALRRLRRYVRSGADLELDLANTIKGTAHNGGVLDIKMRPERRNAVKVLLLLDVGGSMDDHIQVCEALFSAARFEFKHLEHFYFHNCVYERLWKDNRQRHRDAISTLDVMQKFGQDYRLIFVGDAFMSPYEILQPGGSIEHMNPETGAWWLSQLTGAWQRHIWLNPMVKRHWQAPSIRVVKELMTEHMYEMTPAGITDGLKYLMH